MTKRYVASKAGYLPVVYRLYHLYMYGEYKGQPNPATFVTLQLDRCVDPKYPGEKHETVGDTNTRLKGMLAGSDCRWTILACEESEGERKARRQSNGIELVSLGAKIEQVKATAYDPLNGNEEEASNPIVGVEDGGIVPITKSTKVKTVDDDEVGVRRDTGKISVKRGKKPAEKAVAA